MDLVGSSSNKVAAGVSSDDIPPCSVNLGLFDASGHLAPTNLNQAKTLSALDRIRNETIESGGENTIASRQPLGTSAASTRAAPVIISLITDDEEDPGNRELESKIQSKAGLVKKNRKKLNRKPTGGGKESNFKIKCSNRKCKESFESLDAMMYHVAHYHAKGVKKTYSCHLCAKTLSTMQMLRQHLSSVHIGRKPFKCTFPKCSKSFTRKGDMKRHINGMHLKGKAFECTKCPKKFNRKWSLTNHQAYKHGDGRKPFKCPFPKCSKSFVEKPKLNEHVNAVHTKSTAFKCTKCPKTFYYKCNLHRHMAIKHGDGATYFCYLCKKQTYLKSNLERHMNSLHTHRILYQCPIRACSKIFAQKGNLKQHTNAIHTKSTPFKCSKCPQKFFQKAHLRNYLAYKHGNGIKFECHLCKKKLYNRIILQQHMNLMHTGQNLFNCSKCSKEFAVKANLKMHLNRKRVCDRKN